MTPPFVWSRNSNPAPQEPDYLTNLAHAFSDLGRNEEAARHYRRAAELQPGSAAAHHNLAAALTRLVDSAHVQAGAGANEIRTWVAAGAAGGGRPVTPVAYEPVPEWITGMAVATSGPVR